MRYQWKWLPIVVIFAVDSGVGYTADPVGEIDRVSPEDPRIEPGTVLLECSAPGSRSEYFVYPLGVLSVLVTLEHLSKFRQRRCHAAGVAALHPGG